jgi:hypothetical protein
MSASESLWPFLKRSLPVASEWASSAPAAPSSFLRPNSTSGRRRRGVGRGAPPRGALAHDRDGDLGRRWRADVEAAGPVDAREILLADAALGEAAEPRLVRARAA